MATPGYAGELQQTSQPQGRTGAVAPGPSSGPPSATLSAPPQFLADLQTTGAAPAATPGGQSTPPASAPPSAAQKTVVAAPAQPPPAQTQYVTAEIQSSPTQSSNGQTTAQYIVVTVTEGSLHSNDSVSDASPPPAAVQTGVPTQVVQQVQRSVVQTGPPATKTGSNAQLTVTSLQPVHLTQEQLQQVPVQHVYTSQVQYVEGGDASYATSTIRSGSYPYSESPLYSQTAATPYYEAPPASGSQVTTPVTSQTVSVTAGATVAGSDGGGSYVIQGGYMLGSSSSSSSNSNSQNYSHNARASPATVQWLLDNYETAEGVSLPRSTLYCHYLLHCQEQKLEPVNAASFGKLIRSVFMGLRTRRLGTRGNSKYHYYGLRIKASSPLLRLVEDQQHLAMRQQPFSQKQRMKPVQKMEGVTNGVALGAGQQQAAGASDISAQVQQYQQFLDAGRVLPEFAEIDLQGKALPEGIELEQIKSFQLLYREHCEAILDVMVNLQFTLVETLWKTFWRNPIHGDGPWNHDESEKRLPKACLVLLCKYEPVLHWSRQCDNTLYQSLVEILIPDVLRPIPSALTQAIRNFAKSLESWLTNAMMNIPEEMVRIKVTSASAFAQTLRRYTSLNHLAQAARAVLQNTAQINQMLSDLNRVDFANVQEQASWVCRCEDRVVQRLEQDFKLTLQQQNSLEQWAAWLDGVVSQVLKPYQTSPAFPKAAKLFLLKWSFYSSMVIRDLTLRSAASFGSFHLIRLLYDEYMYYLIEHRVAHAKGETPIAVMGEVSSTDRSSRSSSVMRMCSKHCSALRCMDAGHSV
uniref:Regulatory factor X, 1a (influences HLA class II expression) n=1 Tax=Scleropages formosus TaxID=113540 RepID=A0A8C9U344_SCLFO